MGKKFNYCIRIVEETEGVNPDFVDFDSSLLSQLPCKVVTERWYYIDKKGIEEIAKSSLDTNLTMLYFGDYDYEFVADDDGDQDHITSASITANKGDNHYVKWTLTIHKEL